MPTFGTWLIAEPLLPKLSFGRIWVARIKLLISFFDSVGSCLLQSVEMIAQGPRSLVHKRTIHHKEILLRNSAGWAGCACRNRRRKIEKAQEGIGLKTIASAADGGVESATLTSKNLPIGFSPDSFIKFASNSEQGITLRFNFKPARVHSPLEVSISIHREFFFVKAAAHLPGRRKHDLAMKPFQRPPMFDKIAGEPVE